MKITKIEAQVKNKGRYSVFIDEKFSFGISELGLINSGLRVGQEVSTAEVDKLKEVSKTDKIYNQTLGLLARRPRSRWEIEQYLKRKNTDDIVTEQILNTLSEREYVDDYDFAVRWIESRRLLKPISKRKLQLELKQKRISDEIIRNALDNDNTEELEVLKDEILKKRRQTRYQDKTKLMQYLARQGYTYDTIKQALQQLED